MSNQLSRRAFVKTAAIGASAMVTTSVARGYPANEKAQLGWIGIGGRGKHLMKKMLAAAPDARTVAVCDLKPKRIAEGKEIYKRDNPTVYKDMR